MILNKKDTSLAATKNTYARLENRISNSNCDCYYLNLGYWKNTNNTKIACEQMIEEVIKYSNIQNGQMILDAGFGYGDQDIYLSKKFPNLTIHGVNIIENQVQKAQEKVIENGFENQIFLKNGDAVALNFTNNYFDVILAIESAFHFNTREKFFKEAYRTLKKNGVICLTDCLPTDKKENLDFKNRSERFGIPIKNQYDINIYVSILKNIGFHSVQYIDISENVIPYSATEITNRNGWRTEAIVTLPDDKERLNEYIQNFNIATTIEKYYIIKAIK